MFRTILLMIASFINTLPGGATTRADDAFSHRDWRQVLAAVVDSTGRVDYFALAQDRTALDGYLANVRTVSPDSHPHRFPNRDHELAYWINAYNALVFSGVLDRGPDIDSVWAGLISGRGFFVKRKITVGGERMNLKSLEDDIVRARYDDPRVHAALNCASVGCPRLPREPFLGPTLEQQLDAAMREFVNSADHVRFDEEQNTLHLSKIFDWFESDFLDFETRQGNEEPSLVDYVNRYLETEVPQGADIDFIPYDKSLNRQ